MTLREYIEAQVASGRFFPDGEQLDYFVKGYCIALLWASIYHDQDRETFLDENHCIDDISSRSMKIIRNECQMFMNHAHDTLDNGDLEQHGHDFFMTRQGHGVGFYDRDLPKDKAKTLDRIARGFREQYIYAHNGKVEVEL